MDWSKHLLHQRLDVGRLRQILTGSRNRLNQGVKIVSDGPASDTVEKSPEIGARMKPQWPPLALDDGNWEEVVEPFGNPRKCRSRRVALTWKVDPMYRLLLIEIPLHPVTDPQHPSRIGGRLLGGRSRADQLVAAAVPRLQVVDEVLLKIRAKI